MKIFTGVVTDFLRRLFFSKLKLISLSIVSFPMLFCIIAYANSGETTGKSLKLEVKNFDKQLFFVFYHDDSININPEINGNSVNIKFNHNVKIDLVNAVEFSKYATNLSVNSNSAKFSLSKNYKYAKYSKINGEKLTAIRFGDISDKGDESINDTVVSEGEVEYSSKKKTLKTEGIEFTKQNHKDGHKAVTATFHFEKPNVFCSAFYKNGYLYVIFNSEFKFALSKSDYIKFEKIDSFNKEATVLKSKIKNINTLIVNKNGNNWVLSLNSKVIKQNSDVNSKEETDSLEFNVNRANYSDPIFFSDPVIAHKIAVFPLKKGGIGYAKNHSKQTFGVLPSIQGIVLDIYSDETLIEKNDNSVKVSSREVIHSDDSESKSQELSLNSESSSLPFMKINADDVNFNTAQKSLLAEIAKSSSENILYDARVNLANFYFAHQMYNEALLVYELLEKENSKILSNDFQNKFVYAVLMSISDNYNKASEIYDAIVSMYNDSSSLPQELVLWRKFNNSRIYKDSDFIGLNDAMKLLTAYPDSLYWTLVNAELDIAIEKNDINMCEIIFKNSRDPSDKNNKNSQMYKKALAYFNNNDTSKAKRFLVIPLSSAEEDPMNYVRASVLSVKIQRSENSITLGEAIEKLDSLRFKWRGDIVENQLLLTIADYYKQKEDYIEALKIYVNLPNNSNESVFYVASEISDLYIKIFGSDGIVKDLDDFKAVSLFYEFRNNIPIEEGDKIALSMVNRFLNLELLDAASEMLEHQVKNRLFGQEKANVATKLAIVYIMNDQPKNAIEILNATEKENADYDQYLARLRLKAKSFLDIGQFDRAMEYIENDNSEIAALLKKEAYVKSKKWNEYLVAFESMELKKIDETKEYDGLYVPSIVDLGICYMETDNNQGLKNLAHKVSRFKNQELTEIISFMKDANDNVELVAQNLKKLKRESFIDKCKENILKDKLI